MVLTKNLSLLKKRIFRGKSSYQLRFVIASSCHRQGKAISSKQALPSHTMSTQAQQKKLLFEIQAINLRTSRRPTL